MVLSKPRVLFVVGTSLAAIAFTVGISSAVGGGRSATALIPQKMLLKLVTIASEEARAWGDPHAQAVAYSTTRQVANVAAAGEWVDSDQPSYLLVLEGKFSGPMPYAPRPGMKAKGHVLSLVINIRANITDWGVGNRQPSVAALGPGMELRAR